MTTENSNVDSSLQPSKKLTEQLSQLEDKLHNLLACYQFFGEAVRLMTNPEQTTSPEDWHLGLFLNQQWLRQQGEQLLQELVKVKHSLNT